MLPPGEVQSRAGTDGAFVDYAMNVNTRGFINSADKRWRKTSWLRKPAQRSMLVDGKEIRYKQRIEPIPSDIDPRHGKYVNFAFEDGHVQQINFFTLPKIGWFGAIGSFCEQGEGSNEVRFPY